MGWDLRWTSGLCKVQRMFPSKFILEEKQNYQKICRCLSACLLTWEKSGWLEFCIYGNWGPLRWVTVRFIFHVLSHWSPGTESSRNKVTSWATHLSGTCILKTCKRKPSQNCREVSDSLFLSLYSPFLMLCYQRKSWCCCWESHTRTGAPGAPAPPISDGICDLEPHRSVRCPRSNRNWSAGACAELPTADDPGLICQPD